MWTQIIDRNKLNFTKSMTPKYFIIVHASTKLFDFLCID